MQDDDPSDRLLVRPYVQPGAEPKISSIHTEEVPDPLPAPALGDQDTAVLPAVEEPRGPETDAGAADGSDRRTVLWLVGAGLALIVVAAVAIIALWPGGDEDTRTAQPATSMLPGGGHVPSTGPTGRPSPTAKASASASASATPRATGSPTAAGSTPASPPRSAPPAATLAPPPAVDRVGAISGGGHCLDILGGLALPGAAATSYACNGTASQRWTLAVDGTLRDGGMCASTDGSTVRLGGCDASAQWRAGSGGTLVSVSSGKCLTDPSNGAKTGERMTLATCGGAGQRWVLP
jgi:Ricin-type beta-trefoil lectin domain